MPDVPPPPDSFTPPAEITDQMTSFTWYKTWERLDPDEAGVSSLYDPAGDRMWLAPRPEVFHDEMVRTLVSKSGLPRLPKVLSPAALMPAGGDWYADIPTLAEGLQNAMRGLDPRDIKNDGLETELEWVYKHAAAFYVVDAPPETTVSLTYRDQFNAKTFQVPLEALYREMRFDNKLPEQKVEYDRDSQ